MIAVKVFGSVSFLVPGWIIYMLGRSASSWSSDVSLGCVQICYYGGLSRTGSWYDLHVPLYVAYGASSRICLGLRIKMSESSKRHSKFLSLIFILKWLRIKGVFNFLELQPVAKMLRQSDENWPFLLQIAASHASVRYDTQPPIPFIQSCSTKFWPTLIRGGGGSEAQAQGRAIEAKIGHSVSNIRDVNRRWGRLSFYMPFCNMLYM